MALGSALLLLVVTACSQLTNNQLSRSLDSSVCVESAYTEKGATDEFDAAKANVRLIVQERVKNVSDRIDEATAKLQTSFDQLDQKTAAMVEQAEQSFTEAKRQAQANAQQKLNQLNQEIRRASIMAGSTTSATLVLASFSANFAAPLFGTTLRSSPSIIAAALANSSSLS